MNATATKPAGPASPGKDARRRRHEPAPATPVKPARNNAMTAERPISEGYQPSATRSGDLLDPPPADGGVQPRAVSSAPPSAPKTLITHAEAAIGEFVVAMEDGASLPSGAEWAGAIDPWYRFDFEDAENALHEGGLVALPCRAEDRAAAEVSLTYGLQCVFQTCHDADRELLWVRKVPRKTGTTAAPAPVADHSERPANGDYIEHVVRDFRITTPDQAPFDKGRWAIVRDALVEADWETVDFAMRRGQVVALACEPEELSAVETIALYELGGDLRTCYHDGLLWIQKHNSHPAPTGETD